MAVALKQHLTHAGTVGVKALIKIAEKGRSEMARVSAATKLVEISGIRADEASDPARLGREVNINIDLSGSGHGAQIEGADNELRISAQSDRS